MKLLELETLIKANLRVIFAQTDSLFFFFFHKKFRNQIADLYTLKKHKKKKGSHITMVKTEGAMTKS